MCIAQLGLRREPRRAGARSSVLHSKTLPQGGFIPPEEVQSKRGPRFAFTQNGETLGRIEGELEQKLMELRG